MSAPTYEQARREVEEMLGWSCVRGNAVTLHADILRALLSGPPEPTEPVAWREADLGWLRRLVQRQAYSGHCGEENSEIRARQDNDDRIERVLTALASPIPATEPTEEEVAMALRGAIGAHVIDGRLAEIGAIEVQALFRRHRHG